MPRTFPQGFRWGVATSGHQTEGGNTGSDTWFLEHVRPTVLREPFARTPKLSAAVYAAIARANGGTL